MKLFIFGFGYSASRFVSEYGHRFSSIVATTRKSVAPKPAGQDIHPPQLLQLLQWSGHSNDPEIEDAVGEAECILVSIPPVADGDLVLKTLGPLIERSAQLRTIVYLSTIGVYGDHDGGWVDEETVPAPQSSRSIWRLAAEMEWAALAQRKNCQLHVLRLAGIYGPGRNALENQRAGTVRNIIKPGQVFNRIHVDDITQTIAQAFEYSDAPPVSVWNVTDDEPAPPQDIKTYAAQLLGVDAPPAISIGKANLSPMALSFYGENKRVSNAKVKDRLGVCLRYPTYREGLAALAK